MAETYSFCIKTKMTEKEKHRLSQFLQPALYFRRFARFFQQAMKFEELEKREKNPIRRKYYHKLRILKEERAMFYYGRYFRETLCSSESSITSN
jgi:hypothetical protein